MKTTALFNLAQQYQTQADKYNFDKERPRNDQLVESNLELKNLLSSYIVPPEIDVNKIEKEIQTIFNVIKNEEKLLKGIQQEREPPAKPISQLPNNLPCVKKSKHFKLSAQICLSLNESYSRELFPQIIHFEDKGVSSKGYLELLAEHNQTTLNLISEKKEKLKSISFNQSIDEYWERTEGSGETKFYLFVANAIDLICSNTVISQFNFISFDVQLEDKIYFRKLIDSFLASSKFDDRIANAKVVTQKPLKQQVEENNTVNNKVQKYYEQAYDFDEVMKQSFSYSNNLPESPLTNEVCNENCKNGGICIEGECTCNFPYYGADCSFVIESKRTRGLSTGLPKINLSYRFKELTAVHENPCFLKGFLFRESGIIGTGNYEECLIYLKKTYKITENEDILSKLGRAKMREVFDKQSKFKDFRAKTEKICRLRVTGLLNKLTEDSAMCFFK